MNLFALKLDRRMAIGAVVAAGLLLGLGCGRNPGRRSAGMTQGSGTTGEPQVEIKPIKPTPTGGDPNVIKIYSSMPRTGSAKAQTDAIVNGIRMALDESDNKAGKFTLRYEDLDDATAADGKWTAERETANANKAMQDPDCMVYIGPYNSGAAAVSIPILNEGRLLMISPACTGVGLTKKGGEPGEPQKYRPTGTINFTRVVPTDDVQGRSGRNSPSP